jgi:cytochrome c oxidase subunit IV
MHGKLGDIDEGDHKEDSVHMYLVIFFILLALLVATIAAYEIDFSNYQIGGVQLTFVNTIIALTIASVKALLVMLFFMHLRHAKKLTWVVAAAGFVWLTIMVTFTFSDYLSRRMIPENVSAPTVLVSSGLSPDAGK